MSNQDQSTQQQDEASPREVVSETVFVKPRKPKRKFLIGLGVLILIFVLALFFVVQTQVGSRFFLNSVERLSGGRVAFGEVNGRLADQLRIDEVAYRYEKYHRRDQEEDHRAYESESLVLINVGAE